MVVTRLWEFTTKGKEAWSSGTSSTSTSPARPITVPRGDSATQPDEDGSYWNFAVSSMQNAATSVSGKVTSLFGADPPSTQQTEDERTSFYSSYNPFALWSQGTAAAPIITSRLNVIDEFDEDDDHDAGFGASNPTPFHDISRRSMKANSWSNTPHADLLWMFRHDKNPYSAVRGRDTQPYSMTAVRSLVALVPTANTDRRILRRDSSHGQSSLMDDETEVDFSPETSWSMNQTVGKATDEPPPPPPPPPPYDLHRQRSDPSITTTQRSISHGTRRKAVSASETASQLAEGTIRALRDLVLDEAVELQMALRFWNDRWERPLLSWLEAGPLGTSTCSIFMSWQLASDNRFLFFTGLSLVFASRIQPPRNWAKGISESGGSRTSVRCRWRIAAAFASCGLASGSRSVGSFGPGWSMGPSCRV